MHVSKIFVTEQIQSENLSNAEQQRGIKIISETVYLSTLSSNACFLSIQVNYLKKKSQICHHCILKKNTTTAIQKWLSSHQCRDFLFALLTPKPRLQISFQKQGVMNKKPTACRDTKHQSNRYVAIFGVHLLQNAIEYLHRKARYYNYATLATYLTQNVIN